MSDSPSEYVQKLEADNRNLRAQVKELRACLMQMAREKQVIVGLLEREREVASGRRIRLDLSE